ncbi:MAG: helix-turn-helix domain-containing protein [Bacilli bacterium]|nr:helix-turn-helix domain-containing protein [Bacilli bacterium]
MNQEKIGKFISEKRREKHLTQSELAEKLGITDRAISKWENGVCLPDAGTMPELCKILDITINDLFSGEKVDTKKNEKKLEQNLLEMTKMKEEKDKQLLNLEIIIGIVLVTFFLGVIIIALLINMPEWIKLTIIIPDIIIFLIATFFMVSIEQKAGYYECDICHHKYVPTYKSVLFAQHIGRTRKMKCPKCGKKSWQKKVLK